MGFFRTVAFSMKPQLILLSLCLAALGTAIAYADTPAAKPAAPAAAPAKPADSDDGPQKTYPAQSSVAAKGAFGTVAATDKSVTAALDAKALADAKKQVGQTGSFQGTVTQVYSPQNHGFVALDFAVHYRDALTADIAPADYAKFPDLTHLAGKHVLVSGKFVAHGEQTQLAVTSPDGIKVVP